MKILSKILRSEHFAIALEKHFRWKDHAAVTIRALAECNAVLRIKLNQI